MCELLLQETLESLRLCASASLLMTLYLAFAAVASLAVAQSGGPIRTQLDGRCGAGTLTISNIEAECDPDSTAPCCGSNGYCGSSATSCDCPNCTRYARSSRGTRMVRGAATLTCGTKAMDLPGIEGSVLYAFCPGGCAGADTPIWGTDIYTDDSPVCMAAVHAGVLPKMVSAQPTHQTRCAQR